jgi:hypothetical protein
MPLFPDVKGPRRIDALSGDSHPSQVKPPTRFDPQGVSPIVKPNGVAAGPAPPGLPALPILISGR